jgi:hypothetical protein
MSRAFISYSHRDSPHAEWLAQWLGAQGARIWIDLWEIGVGDSIVERINEGIAASDYLLALLSPNSVASRWVKEEINAALVTTIEQRGAKLLPVLLEECSLPPLIATRRYADLSRPETRHAELGALLAAMGLAGAEDAPVLLPDEVAVLNVLRGKPDVKWTVSLIADRLASTQRPLAMALDVEGTVESLRRQGFVYTDESGLVHVSDKAVEFFRSRGRRSPSHH